MISTLNRVIYFIITNLHTGVYKTSLHYAKYVGFGLVEKIIPCFQHVSSCVATKLSME
jgi:hypothetical protein